MKERFRKPAEPLPVNLIHAASLCPRILGRIRKGLRLIVSDVLDSEELEYFEECLSVVTECNSTVVRISLLDEHVTIEASHFLDGEDCDAAEGTGRNVEDLALSNVGNELAVAVALQTIEGDVACCDVAFERSAGEIRIASCGLKQTVLNELILDGAVCAHLAGRSISAMEAHEGIGKLVVVFALDSLVVDVLRNGVVDIKKRDGVVGYASADVLGKSTVDIYFTGYRNATACKTAVYIARL